MATHRTSMSGLKVEEQEKHGREMARQRYGQPQHFTGAPPPDDSLQKPQAPEDQHGKNYDNDSSGWVRGAGERAENKPGGGYIPGHKGGK